MNSFSTRTLGALILVSTVSTALAVDPAPGATATQSTNAVRRFGNGVVTQNQRPAGEAPKPHPASPDRTASNPSSPAPARPRFSGGTVSTERLSPDHRPAASIAPNASAATNRLFISTNKTLVPWTNAPGHKNPAAKATNAPSKH